MNAPRRLLTIGHSYAVALNRRLPQEIARASSGGWSVTAAAPARFHGDFGVLQARPEPDEPCALAPVPAYLTRHIHLMFYGRKLRRLLQQEWDLIHCWEEPYILSGAQVAYWSPPGVPLIYATFQNLPKRYPPPFGWFERRSLKRAAGWIGFGETVVATLEGQPAYAARPHRAIPPGVDTVCFRPDPDARAETLRKLNWSAAGPPIVGFLGRFVEAKGLRPLMRRLERVAPEWRALMVGGGPLEPELRVWAERQGDRVRVATKVPHDQAAAYLNAMDLLCAPSLTTTRWREQFGRMLIEAFACGVPVMASDSGEIPHVVSDAGVVVAEGDDSAWVTALDRLLRDPAAREELARRGMARARSVFAWPVIARRHLEFFEEMLAPKGPR